MYDTRPEQATPAVTQTLHIYGEVETFSTNKSSSMTNFSRHYYFVAKSLILHPKNQSTVIFFASPSSLYCVMPFPDFVLLQTAAEANPTH